MLQTASYKSRAMSFGLSLSLQLTIRLLICTITINLGSGIFINYLFNFLILAEYLNRFKTSTLEQTMSFTYSRRTETKWLTMDQLQNNKKLNDSIAHATVVENY